jgi:Ca2+-transporting ATPase
LPSAATIGLALGITRMREHHVLVRHLQAVETLGAVQTICLDKTGTLTLNRMAVQSVYCDGRLAAPETIIAAVKAGESADCFTSARDLLLAVCALCNETKINGAEGGRQPQLYGSSTENALVHLAQDAGWDVNAFKSTYPLITVNHRSESRLYMSTLHQYAPDHRLLALKGSPPEVLSMCDRMIKDGEVVALSEGDRLDIEKCNEQMAGGALRVLGFAYRLLAPGDPDDVDAGLVFIGLVGMADPIRPGVKALIRMFHTAGIQTVMITGDQSATAFAVARELDLSRGAPLDILDSSELSALEPRTLQALAGKAHVYARVSPVHKLKIVQALQAAGKVVAMTGDGINDGPALKAADIGIAMGRTGTDVARDVADIVLEEDHLEILARALGDGRTIYGNIRKSVQYFLSTNISEIALMFAAMALGLGFPLSVMQLLWINIISDIFPGLALAMEAPEPDVLRQAPRDSRAPIFNRTDFRRLVAESSTISAAALAA